MLLACKYEEISVPVVEDLVIICDRAYTRSDILEMVHPKTLTFSQTFLIFFHRPIIFFFSQIRYGRNCFFHKPVLKKLIFRKPIYVNRRG